jgi:HK97 family phage major capsid protein
VTDLQRRSAERYGYQGGEVLLRMPESSYKAPRTIAEAQKRCDLAWEKRADTLTDAAGAFTVDEITMSELEKALLSWGSLRQACTVIRTMNGAPLLLPATDDTGNPGELLAETDTAATIDLVFTQVAFGSYMWSSGQIPVTYQLLDDTAINLPAEIGELAGIRLGRIQNTYMTTGTGTAQPEGIVTGATDSGVVAADVALVTWQELIQLKHSVDQGYRQSPKEGYMTSDTGLAAMKQMIGQLNTPVWQPSLVPNAPDTYDGSPVWVNNDIDVPAATKLSYIYGDLGKFVIRDVASYIRFLRLDEIAATSAQVIFLAFMRSDSRIRQPAAIKYLTMAAS